ncbi:MAG: type IV pilin [Asgard group archaeon]|nr:type IV pilin [Asgard group archaeon]
MVEPNMIKKIKRLYHRRKAVSPVVAALLLIALTVAAVALVYFVLIPMFRTHKLEATIISVSDTNKDSLYDQITMQFANTGTQVVEIYNLTIWISNYNDMGNPNNWIPLADWEFKFEADASINPSIVKDVAIIGDQQIGLSIEENTYCRVEIMFHGSKNPKYIDWFSLNDYFDLADLLIDFSFLNFTATAFEGTIDDPSRVANNYHTSGGPYELIEDSFFNWLPVLNETDIQFYVGDAIMIMNGQAPSGNLSDIPLVQTAELPIIFRAHKFYILGLAGSWGDEFPDGAWSLNVTITYTDNSTSEWSLGEDYIDDWWYPSNDINACTSAPFGKITEIDLGNQVDTPHSHIHTHTTRFYIDFYKYVKSITFTDPGTDWSSAHIIAITFR